MVVQDENPKYLNCMWCSAQATPKLPAHTVTYQLYICPAGHKSYIEPQLRTIKHGTEG